MRSKIVQTMEEAVADVPDGATIMFPGFGRTGYPRNLIAALLRQGAKGLTGISNRPGNPGAVMDVGHLIEAGRMKKMVCAFTASPYPSRKSSLEIMEEAGEIVSELVPQGTFVERIRAAGAGIGGFYTETGVGTEIAEDKERRTIDGRDHILEFPLPADYAFIRAYRADALGNLQFRLTQRNFNPIMAMAATDDHSGGGAAHSRSRRNRPGRGAHAGPRRRPGRQDPAGAGWHLGHRHQWMTVARAAPVQM